MSENHVHVAHLQALQRSLDSLDQMLARESTAVGVLVADTKEDLGDDHKLVAVVVKLLEDASKLTLTLAFATRATSAHVIQIAGVATLTIAVNLCSVKGVHTCFPCGLYQLLHDIACSQRWSAGIPGQESMQLYPSGGCPQ